MIHVNMGAIIILAMVAGWFATWGRKRELQRAVDFASARVDCAYSDLFHYCCGSHSHGRDVAMVELRTAAEKLAAHRR